MDDLVVLLALVGAFAFGVVIGWVTYGSLRRAKRNGLTDISTILGIVGGAAVLDLFPVETGAFGVYSIGLAIGFFGYLKAAKKPDAPAWLGEERERQTEVPDGGRRAPGGEPELPPVAR